MNSGPIIIQSSSACRPRPGIIRVPSSKLLCTIGEPGTLVVVMDATRYREWNGCKESARVLRDGCRNQNSMAMSCVWTVNIPCLGASGPPSRSETLPPQRTALPICPERIPARSPHRPIHSVDVDSLALCTHSGRSHAQGHPWSSIGVRGVPNPATFKTIV